MRRVPRKYLYIGAHPFWSAQKWKGTIANALVWDRQVSWSEMRAALEAPPPEPPVVQEPVIAEAHVVMGMPIGAATIHDEGPSHPWFAPRTEPPSASASVSMTLIEMVEVLKRELQVEGNAKSVVEHAARELGVVAEGKPLMELARQCIAALGL